MKLLIIIEHPDTGVGKVIESSSIVHSLQVAIDCIEDGFEVSIEQLVDGRKRVVLETVSLETDKL